VAKKSDNHRQVSLLWPHQRPSRALLIEPIDTARATDHDANVSELRIAEDNTASFSRLQRIFCALCDHLAFVLSDSGENVNGELVRVRIIDSDELHA
jgi:hypothetical protein